MHNVSSVQRLWQPSNPQPPELRRQASSCHQHPGGTGEKAGLCPLRHLAWDRSNPLQGAFLGLSPLLCTGMCGLCIISLAFTVPVCGLSALSPAHFCRGSREHKYFWDLGGPGHCCQNIPAGAVRPLPEHLMASQIVWCSWTEILAQRRRHCQS